MIKIPQQNSLRKLPKDARDFNLGAIFGQLDLNEIPSDDFVVATPILIKEQPEGDDECSGYAVTAVSEDQEEVELIPQYQFFKTKEISGDPEEWGANLRDACKSAVKFGSLPLDGFKQVKTLTRREATIPENFPNHADDVASLHKKSTYFEVKGKYDVFDNIRMALYQHRTEKCSIVTGVLFRGEWLSAPNGIIPNDYGTNGFGHAFKFFGQKTIKGEMYLVAQLSQGINVGDGGLFYFNRQVTNREIGEYGIFMFKDLSREEVDKILKKKQENQQVTESFFSKIWSFLIGIFR